MRTRIAQVVERRSINREVRGSNLGSGSNLSLEILKFKFPKAQIMNLFSIKNLI